MTRTMPKMNPENKGIFAKTCLVAGHRIPFFTGTYGQNRDNGVAIE
jgi:hypothetical protein